MNNPSSRLPMSVGSRGIELRTFEDMQRMAAALVASGFAPKGDTQASVIAKMQLGLEVGIGPMMALKSIAVVNQRPSLFGDAGKALLLRSGLLDGPPSVEFTGQPMKPDWTCTVTLRRKGMGPFVGRFTWAQAVRAKLAGKSGPWSEYPERQMEWRAFWFAARDGFADVLGGLYGFEESRDIPPEPATVTIEPSGKPRMSRLEDAVAARADAWEGQPDEAATETPDPSPAPDASQEALEPDPEVERLALADADEGPGLFGQADAEGDPAWLH